MSGISDLRTLLAAMDPGLVGGVYTFATIPAGECPAGLRPLGTFRESEGLTVICSPEEAQHHGLGAAGSFRLITLNVPSSLAAVGFLAEISHALRRAGLPCNVVSAFHHDHLLIPADQAAAALRALQALSASARE